MFSLQGFHLKIFFIHQILTQNLFFLYVLFYLFSFVVIVSFALFILSFKSMCWFGIQPIHTFF